MWRRCLLIVGLLAVAGPVAACGADVPTGGAVLFVVDLQEGFDGDTVSVTVDGTETVVEATTNLMTGFAETVEATVEPGAVELRIDVDDGRLVLERELDVVGDLFVGVNIEGGTPTLIISEDPFGYG